jgi:phospholipid/cholesterol/gamma-HCH transport system permease protein
MATLAEGGVEGRDDVYRVSGALTIGRAATTDRELADMPDGMTIDLSQIERVDTVGAWLIYRATRDRGATVVGANKEVAALIEQVSQADEPVQVLPDEPHGISGTVSEIGEWVEESGRTLKGMVGFLGATMIGGYQIAKRPLKRLRMNAVVQRFDLVGVRALGIIGLMSFLIGIVIGQQGAVQLAAFGAEVFTINRSGD